MILRICCITMAFQKHKISTPIMRTARLAGLVAGAVCLQAIAASAGEGPALRGLKPPASALEAYQFSVSDSAAAREDAEDAFSGLSARALLAGGSYVGQRASAGDLDYRLSVQRAAGQSIAALAEPGAGNLADPIPRYTLHTSLARKLPGGWGIGLGMRQREYNFGGANLFALSAQRAFGSFRSAYTLYSNVAEGSHLGSAHRFEVSYLYGDRNTIGLSFTTGRDVENFGPPATLLAGDVRDWSLSGRHWLSPNWALTYDVMSQEQPLARRQGLRLGVSRSF